MRPGGGWHGAEMISVWFFASKRSSAKSNVLAVVTRWNTPAIDSMTDLNGAHQAPSSDFRHLSRGEIGVPFQGKGTKVSKIRSGHLFAQGEPKRRGKIQGVEHRSVIGYLSMVGGRKPINPLADQASRSIRKRYSRIRTLIGMDVQIRSQPGFGNGKTNKLGTKI